MPDPAYRVELAASFLEWLDSIEPFLAEADAPHAYDTLLAALRVLGREVVAGHGVKGRLPATLHFWSHAP